MKKELYFIHDKLKSEYDADELMLQLNDEMAKRAMFDIVAEKTYIWKHAGDFELISVGKIDEDGLHEYEKKEVICQAKDIKQLIEIKEEEEAGRKALANKPITEAKM